MSPTVFREGPYRFYFFSREEPRMHVHVYSGDGEAKFWIEPEIALVHSHGLNSHQLKRVAQHIEEHIDEIKDAWERRGEREGH